MKKLITLLSVFFCVTIFAATSYKNFPANKTFETKNTAISATTSKAQTKNIASLKIKDAEKLMGRKMTLKEKIAFKLFRHQLKKSKTGDETGSSKEGKTAFILGLIALSLIFVPFAALASIPLAIIAIVKGNNARKLNPEDKKAKTGVVLGWVALGLIALSIIIGVLLIVAFLGMM
jgi:hypothetical protein